MYLIKVTRQWGKATLQPTPILKRKKENPVFPALLSLLTLEHGKHGKSREEEGKATGHVGAQDS